MTWNPPNGFNVVLNYSEDSINGIPIVGCASLALEAAPGGKLIFNLENGIPKLPLKTYGQFWHEGWDIPTYYAIDTDNICWMDNVHGHPLEKVSVNVLLWHISNELLANEIRNILGLSTLMPSWARTALAHGWKPPENK